MAKPKVDLERLLALSRSPLKNRQLPQAEVWAPATPAESTRIEELRANIWETLGHYDPETSALLARGELPVDPKRWPAEARYQLAKRQGQTATETAEEDVRRTFRIQTDLGYLWPLRTDLTEVLEVRP